ncbi:MAG: 23S rRNA (guanosine(2251)-2'-O)-methyltransferase RlmB [Candidatus Aminicenantes bacterium]|nr:23S rRNA (guanosine(2251)-2'-O)-methyltransferase RlmB [Candidatus Aminicenantes bacterium]
MNKISRIHPVLEAIRSSPKKINKILLQKDLKKQSFQEILSIANKENIPVVFTPRNKMDQQARRHQGIIALVAPKKYTPLDTIMDSASLPFLLLLDQIEDPQNLGAIVRTAEGAGVDGIILPERRSAGLTSAVFEVSSGALVHVPVSRVKNLARTMDELRKREVWLIGAEQGSPKLWYEFDYTVPVGIVMGSEAKGLRRIIRKKCDEIRSLPLDGKVGSLNVGSAASVFLYEVVRQRQKKTFEAKKIE